MALAAHHAIPTIYFQKEFVAAGGLISYGPHFADGYRQAGIYVRRGSEAARRPSRARRVSGACLSCLASDSFGSLSMLPAMRRASSQVSSLAAARRPAHLRIDIRQRVPNGVAPRRGDAAAHARTGPI